MHWRQRKLKQTQLQVAIEIMAIERMHACTHATGYGHFESVCLESVGDADVAEAIGPMLARSACLNMALKTLRRAVIILMPICVSSFNCTKSKQQRDNGGQRGRKKK